MILFLKDRNMTSETYPIFMIDILCSFITHSTDPNLYKGYYYISSYTYKIESNTNQVINSFLEAKFGEAKYLSTEISINMYIFIFIIYEFICYRYQSLMFLRNAVETSKTYNSDSVKDEMYRLTLSLPGGEISISDSNMCVLGIYLLKCIGNNDYEIVLSPASLLDVYPISYDVYIIFIIHLFIFFLSLV